MITATAAAALGFHLRSRNPARQPAVPGAGPCVPAVDELVSVVVCTLGREPHLVETVRAVLSQTHPQLDLVVVDNAPASGGTAALLGGITDPRLRVVEEPRRGLSAARNAGLRAARGALIAYTDDDAVPDATWIAELLAVLRSDRSGDVTCVTGRVVAAETATVEQAWFEAAGIFDKGLERTVWALGSGAAGVPGTPGRRTVFFPYTAGEMGSGNNMIFRTAALRALGGFDEALGAGSPAKGGEDLDMFRRVILARQVLVYTPTALVRHYHRQTFQELRSQMFGYGAGMAAALTKVVLRGGRPAVGVLRCLPRGAYTLLWPTSTKNVKKPDDMPRVLIHTELRGYLAGPFLYLWGLLLLHRRRAFAPAGSAGPGGFTVPPSFVPSPPAQGDALPEVVLKRSP